MALIVGAFAERARFSAVLLSCCVWFTFSYIPMAHIVWGGGYLGKKAHLTRWRHRGAHHAGIAGLVGAYMVGKRIGYGKEAMAPHSLTLTMVGASCCGGLVRLQCRLCGCRHGAAGLAFVNTCWRLPQQRCPGSP